MIEFSGPDLFRQRLILSCVSGKPIKIINIRSSEENPGLKGIFGTIQLYNSHFIVSRL